MEGKINGDLKKGVSRLKLGNSFPRKGDELEGEK